MTETEDGDFHDYINFEYYLQNRNAGRDKEAETIDNDKRCNVTNKQDDFNEHNDGYEDGSAETAEVSDSDDEHNPLYVEMCSGPTCNGMSTVGPPNRCSDGLFSIAEEQSPDIDPMSSEATWNLMDRKLDLPYDAEYQGVPQEIANHQHVAEKWSLAGEQDSSLQKSQCKVDDGVNVAFTGHFDNLMSSINAGQENNDIDIYVDNLVTWDPCNNTQHNSHNTLIDFTAEVGEIVEQREETLPSRQENCLMISSYNELPKSEHDRSNHVDYQNNQDTDYESEPGYINGENCNSPEGCTLKKLYEIRADYGVTRNCSRMQHLLVDNDNIMEENVPDSVDLAVVSSVAQTSSVVAVHGRRPRHCDVIRNMSDYSTTPVKITHSPPTCPNDLLDAKFVPSNDIQQSLPDSSENQDTLPRHGHTKSLLAHWRDLEQRRRDEELIERAAAVTADRSRRRAVRASWFHRPDVIADQSPRSHSCGPAVDRPRTSRRSEDAAHTNTEDEADSGSIIASTMNRSAIRAKFEQLDADAQRTAVIVNVKKEFKWKVRELTSLCRPVGIL